MPAESSREYPRSTIGRRNIRRSDDNAVIEIKSVPAPKGSVTAVNT